MSNLDEMLFIKNNLNYLIKTCESLKTDSLVKYVYLEKALLANSKNKRNEGYFTSEDTNQLMNAFNIKTSELLEVYCEVYGEIDKSNKYDISPNFYKMLKSQRSPSVILIKALIKIILNIRIVPSDDGSYSSDNIIKSKFNYKSLSFDERNKIESYVKFCIIISNLESSYLKPYEFEEGKKILKNKALKNKEILIPLLFNTSLIWEYINPFDGDDLCDEDIYKTDLEVYYEEIWQSIEGEPSLVKLPDYITICSEWKDNDLNMFNYFNEAPNGLLIFLRNNMKILQELDQNFWQLLFLLQFFPYEDLQELRRYQPLYTFTVKKQHLNDYYKLVKLMVELPDIEEAFLLSSDVKKNAVQAIIMSKEEVRHLPNWAYFVMRNIRQEHIVTVKYLYLTFVLGYRYRHIEQNNRLSKELLDLLIKQNKNIKDYIEKIDKLPCI